MVGLGIKRIRFVLDKSFQGYRLLKNPKGFPCGYVRMIKRSSYINPKTLDIHECYMRVTKDFSQNGYPEKAEYFFADKYLFFENEKPLYKRASNYSFYDLPTHKNSMSVSKRVDYKNRDLSLLEKIVMREKVLVPDVATSFLGFPLPKEKNVVYTMRDVLFNKLCNKHLK